MVRFRESAGETPAHRSPALAARHDRYRRLGTEALFARESAEATRAADDSMGIVVADPGEGMALHDRAAEQVYMPLKGQWLVSLGDLGEEEVLLGELDILSVPPGMQRGFCNADKRSGYLLIINAAETAAHADGSASAWEAGGHA